MVFLDVMLFGLGCDICFFVYYYLMLISKYVFVIFRLIYIEENWDKNVDVCVCFFVEIILYYFC